VRQVSLLDELGQVSHIFSDKTGTLTSNLMSFRRCYVCGVEYGVGETAIAKSLRAMAEDADRPPEVAISQRPPPAHGGCGPRASRYVGFEEAEGAPSLFDALEGDTVVAARHREFMLHQAINHSVLIEMVGGQEELCASSPDEQAFVSAAECFGYAFVERRPDVGELDIVDKRSGERHTVQACARGLPTSALHPLTPPLAHTHPYNASLHLTATYESPPGARGLPVRE
jgi:phospholipid-transporting ATPase